MLLFPTSALAIIPWDCDTYPLPMQMLKGNSDTYYRLVELDIVQNAYIQRYQFMAEPSKWMNGAAYNRVDGVAYAVFQYTSGNPRVLCRFSHLADSQECFCESGSDSLYSATISSSGHYYLSVGGNSIKRVANVANVTATTPLSACPMTTILPSKSAHQSTNLCTLPSCFCL